MNITVEILRRAGCSAELIVRILEIADEDRTSRNRENNRIRQRNHRSRNDVTRYARDRRDIPPGYTSPPKEKPKKVSHSACTLPPDFSLNENDQAFAEKHGWDAARTAHEFDRFKAHAEGNGRRQADWHGTWRSWVMSPYNNPKNGQVNGYHRETTADKGKRLIADMDAKMRSAAGTAGSDEGRDQNVVCLPGQQRRLF